MAALALELALIMGAGLSPATVAAQSPAPSAVESPSASDSPLPVAAAPGLRVVVPPTVAPSVDVYLDGALLQDLADFASGSVSDRAAVPPGAHQVAVFAQGSDPAVTAPIASILVDFGEDGLRTVAIRGDGSAVVLDDATVPPSTGASLRLVDLDTGAGPVDAWLGDRQLALGLSPVFPSSRFVVDAGTQTLTTNAPGDRLSLFASEDITVADGTALTAYMVPTSERAAWFLAADAAAAITPDASPSTDPGSSPTLGPPPSTDPDALEWRTLPVYECDLQIAFVTEGENTGTRRTGSAEVQVPASLRNGLALFHAPVMPERDPGTGWALGPDGWTCVRHLGADFDTMVSGLTIRSQGAGRAAAATCGAFGCRPAVGSDTGRYIAYGSQISGADTRPISAQYGVPGTTACTYLRPFRLEVGSRCHGIPTLPGHHHVPATTPDGSNWVDFSTARGGDTVVGAVGVDCGGDGCLPHLIECKLRPEDRALCDTTLQVMLDPGRVRVPRIAASLACPGAGAAALVRAGDAGDPPGDYRHARVVRTLRGAHDLVLDGVPAASIFAGGHYPAVCHGDADRLWYRVRSVDGDRVNGWIAQPLIRPASH